MMKNDLKHDKQGYILRYYLPVKPYFDEEYTEKRFVELLEFCKNAKVDAVMFFVALHPDSYYMPETPEYAESWRNQMLPYIKRLREAGIGYQLNFQNLLGANTFSSDYTNQYNWENLVDYIGRESTGAGCPIGEEFRKQSGRRLQLWAETEPDVIWLDDDFRMHNHGTPYAAQAEGEDFYLDFYCFCDNHMHLFNERNGTDFDRESLVKEILRPGRPSKYRKVFLDFIHDTMTETAKWVEQTVHSVSPKTQIALMTSMPDVHAAEGRRWNEFLTALCGEYAPILRPTFGPYREQEQPPRDFITSYQRFGHLKAQIRQSGLSNVEYCPEVENTQFTVWAKSTMASSYQLSLSAFLGCKDITLSLYDLDGGAFFEELRYEEMLWKQKPFLDNLVSLNLGDAKELGVAIPVSQKSGRNYILKDGGDYEDIGGKERNIESVLLKMGIPCRFISPEEFESGDIVALDGFSASFLTNAEIDKFLCGGVLLDGEAAKVLCDRGFSDKIGVKVLNKQDKYVQSEVFCKEIRNDGTYVRMPLRTPILHWYAYEALAETEVLSIWLTPIGEKSPGISYFENKSGGRVAVFPGFNQWGSGFYNHNRVRIFKDLIQRLGDDIPRLDCASYTLFVVREKKDGERYYLISNLSSDPTVEFTINGKTVRVELNIYQTAVYREEDGMLELIGKTL